MKTQILSFLFFITLTINISTPCLAIFPEAPIFSDHQKELNTEMENLVKGLGAIVSSLFLSIAIDSYFEYQDDIAISKIKTNDSEYKNAKSWKKKAKISKAIVTEYYHNFTFKKKWGRKCIRAATLFSCFGVAFIYFKRSFYADFT